jgi:hypothetical protein
VGVDTVESLGRGGIASVSALQGVWLFCLLAKEDAKKGRACFRETRVAEDQSAAGSNRRSNGSRCEEPLGAAGEGAANCLSKQERYVTEKREQSNQKTAIQTKKRRKNVQNP